MTEMWLKNVKVNQVMVKINLFLCKALTNEYYCLEVTGKLHASAVLLPAQETQVRNEQKTCCALELAWPSCIQGKYFVSAENRTRITPSLTPQPNNYTDCESWFPGVVGVLVKCGFCENIRSNL